MRIAAAEGVARQLLGGGAVGLDQQRRKALRLGLIAESVDEILGWKLVGGRGLVAQQIAHGVVELAVRQPPQFGLRHALARAGSLLLAIFQRLRQFGAGKLRSASAIQAFSDASSWRARLDPFAAAVRDPVGRLVQQQGAIRLLPVDQRHQRSSEGLDSSRARHPDRGNAGGCRMPRRPDYGRNGRQPSPSPDKGPIRKDLPGPKREKRNGK